MRLVCIRVGVKKSLNQSIEDQRLEEGEPDEWTQELPWRMRKNACPKQG